MLRAMCTTDGTRFDNIVVDKLSFNEKSNRNDSELMVLIENLMHTAKTTIFQLKLWV